MNGFLKTSVMGIAGCGMLALLGLGSTAQALPMVEAGVAQDFTVNFDGNVSTVDQPGLTGTADFSFDGNLVNGDTYVFDVILTNTTDAALWDDSRISRLAFDMNPDILSGSSTGDWTVVFTGGSLPNQFGDVEVCVGGSGGACQGGGGSGPGIGESISFQLSLTFNNPPPASIEFSNFGVRWQSLTNADGSISGGSGTGSGTCCDQVPPIPEPSLVAMLGVGMLGIGGLMGWRRRED